LGENVPKGEREKSRVKTEQGEEEKKMNKKEELNRKTNGRSSREEDKNSGDILRTNFLSQRIVI